MSHGKWQLGFAGKATLLLHLAAALVLWQFVLWCKGQPVVGYAIRDAVATYANQRTVGVVSSPHLSLPQEPQARFYDPNLALAAERLDAASRYYAAIALEECYALSHDGVARFRDNFLRRLNSGDSAAASNREREHAFNRGNRDCVAFDNLPISPKYVLELLESAARDGDARAIARALLFRDLGESKIGNFDIVSRLLSTGDPHVIRDVGLYLTRGETALAMGDNAAPVNATTLAVAWELVACDFGLDCGADSKLLNNLCAYQGQCGAISYEDWICRHTESREELAEILRVRLLLRRGLMMHDWQLLGLNALRRESRSLDEPQRA